MIKINIYLIGMMGSGKSTIGQILADRLSMSWFDMDEVIENRGMKIPEIFEQYGETKFREIEMEVICQMANETRSVVSTGGGVILKPQNVETMRSSGHVVYLKASQGTLLRNFGGHGHRCFKQLFIADHVEYQSPIFHLLGVDKFTAHQ